MANEYNSKHGIVSKNPFELYMAFADMRNFVNMLPEDKKSMITADYDHISATVQGFNVGARVIYRQAYSRIDLEDDGAPVHFNVSLYFDATPNPGKTEFYIKLSAELNLMMKMMLGPKLRDALDKIVDGIVAVSEGRVPDGVDPSMVEEYLKKQ